MKNFTLLFSALLLTAFSWQANAQLSEDFEGATFPPTGWTEDFVSGTANWAANSGNSNGSVAGAQGGTLNAMFYSANYNGDATKLVSPSMDLSILPSYDLSFWRTQNDWGGDQDELAVYYKTSAAGTWTLLASFTSSTPSWVLETISLPALSNDYYLAFEATSGYGYGVTIDDIAVAAGASCSAPSAGTATNITSSSADLAWTENGTATVWDIEYGVAPYTPTGTPTVSGVTNPYNTSGLTANTTYEFYVRADCGGANGTSAWAGPYSFFTGYCIPSSSSANTYVDNFSTSNGSANISNLTSGFTAGGYGDWTAQAVESFETGTFNFNAEIVGGTAGFSIWIDWNNDLVFDNVTEKVFNTTAYGSGPFTGTITIPALTAIGDYRMRISTDWNQSNPSNPCGAQTRAEFEDYTITVGNPPSCTAPSSLTSSNVTGTSVDLGWTATGTETAWNIQYGPAGFTPGTGTTVAVGTNPYTLTGLTSNTAYDFWIQADCGADSSAYAGPSSFTTPFVCPAGAQCATLGTEISTDFDFTALPGTSTCPGVLSVTIPAGDIVDSVATFYDMSAVGGGWMAEQRSWLYSPSVGAGEAATSNGAGNATGTINYNRTGVSFANTATGTVDFELHAGRTYGGAGCDNTFNLVEPGWTIVVYHSLAPACSQPSSLTATNVTGTSVDLGWTATGTETAWNIQYGPAGFTPGTGTIVAAGTNPYTLTGLTSSTSYDFWIQADCGADSSAYAGPSSFTTPFVCPAGAQCASLAGEVSTDYDFTALGGVSTCPGTLSVTIPAGNIVDSVTTFYDMTAGVGASGLAWMSEQRSWLYSPTVGAGEAALSQGVGAGGGTVSYNRTGISFANTATGTVDFELHAGRTWGGAGCDNTYNKVDAGSWTVVVYHSLAPLCFNPTALNATSVTSTSVNLEWTAGSNETQWNLEYGPAGFTPGTGTVANAVTTNPYAITGLNGNTAYDFYVQADCGANGTSNMTGPGTFTTLCAAFTLPWSENFDAGTTTPTCWSQGSANAENWLFGATGGHVGNVGVIGGATTSGNNFAWIDDSTPDNTGTTLESPLVDVSSLTVPMLSFYLISNNEGNGGTNVNFSVDVWDGAAWNVGVYASNSNTLNGEWQQISVVLSSLTITGPVQLRFIVDEDPTSAYFDDVAIDDVTFVEAPACPDPTLLSATNITTASADLGWTENGTATSWEIEYGSTSFVQGTGNTVVTGTNPHALTGLAANYSYDFYVRAICGAGDTSVWVGPINFSTPCNAVTAFPFTESFEDSSVTRSCWSNIQEVGSADWTYATGSGGGTILTAYSGTKNARFVSSGPAGGGTPATKLVSPEMDLTSMTNPRVVFYYGQEEWAPDQNYTELYYRENSAAAWTLIWSDSTSINAWTEAIVTLPSPSANYQIAFEGINNWGRANVIDEVMVEETPACVAATALASDSITISSAELSWVAGGSETMWNIEYGPAGFTLGSGTAMTGVTNPYTVTGLMSGTLYDFYVQSDCGGLGTSSFAGPANFFTNATCLDTLSFCYGSDIQTLFVGEATTPGDYVTVTILAGETEVGFDSLQIYEGTGTSGALLYNNDGDHTGITATSTTGIITVVVAADGAYDCQDGLGGPYTPLEIAVSCSNSSSVFEQPEAGFSVYPNPSNGNFIIALTNLSEQVSVQVFDVQGRVVYSQTEGLKVGKENAITLDNVERGVYLVSVSSEKGRYTQSIVVE
jgi:hypothetical protein